MPDPPTPESPSALLALLLALLLGLSNDQRRELAETCAPTPAQPKRYTLPRLDPADRPAAHRGRPSTRTKRGTRTMTTWTPDPDLERLRELRDAVPGTTAITPTQRLAVGHYERNLRAHLDAGGTLPEGVTAP